MQIIKTFEELERRNKKHAVSSTGNFESDSERKTLTFIEECLNVSNNPVVLCSFGKDSLVMLHMVLRLKRVPVIYWREPYYQTKFKHAQEVAEKWDLEIYDYPPTFTDYFQIEDYFDVYNFYYVNGIDYVNLYTGTTDYKKEESFLCAIDLLLRPKVSNYQFRWDCIFHGHKQCDPVYITDKIEVPRLQLFGNGIMSMPIKDWTNQEIWEYIEKYNLPYNKDRYDDGKTDRNNDIFPTCHDCLDYRNDKRVICPKYKKEIMNIGKSKEKHIEFRDKMLSKIYRRT